ncbi:MAG: ABC transporter ATP-binding protein [Anaerolineae bacterium]|nr:ABC transporter ATP-binding protein [Caldilineales bacterium]MCX7852985.1 ABC transporter ATP-binding protein [Caldilineales bacterium]MDW8267959.1 ABC transporter ATP-binding protein [Anaerolineae bacterium]
MNAVVVEHLTKRFGRFVAVNDISFTVARGEIFGFLGPNGSGKTTTIRMLLGLLPPTSGQARVLDVDVVRHPERIARRVGYMSQKFSLYPDLTVEENLRFYGRTYGLRGRALARRQDEVLALIGLEAQRRRLTAALAGGWKQKLALATALLHRPELLVLDEPTAGVDPINRREFWRLLYGLAGEGVTVFVTTHYMDEAEQCHRLALIHNGVLLAVGAPDVIKQTHMPGQVVEVLCARPRVALPVLRAADLAEVALYGERIHIAGPNLEHRLDELRARLEAAGAGVIALRVIPPSLEDVFIAQTSTR